MPYASNQDLLTTLPSDATTPYQRPGWLTREVLNRMVRRLARLGVSIRGSAELRVRGRTSGEWRSNPVNPLTIGDSTYLVAARGETEWVRNLRIAGEGELRVGRSVAVFVAEEVPADQKPELLREYLRRWKAEVGAFFAGVDATASDESLRAIADSHPVFAVYPT